MCEEGIESRIADLVGNKQAFFKGLFDGDSDAVKFDQAGSFLSRVQKLYDPATLAAATAVGGTEEIELTDLADVEPRRCVADPFDELIEAGDESHDLVEPAAEQAPVLAIVPGAAGDPPAPAEETGRSSGGRPPCRPPARSASCSPSSRSAGAERQHRHRGARRGRIDPAAPCSKAWPPCSRPRQSPAIEDRLDMEGDLR